MASKPFFDPRRGEWKMKYRPDPERGWVPVKLCKHPTSWSPSKPPKKPPQEALDRAREFEEIEYRARHGLGSAPARAKALAAYLESYADSHALSARKNSNKQLRRAIREFLAFAETRGVTSIQGANKVICRDFLEHRLKSVTHNSLRSERGILMGAWSRAVEDELIPANPWKHVKVSGKSEETSITFWTSEEIGKIVAACKRPLHRDLILVLANTGLRISTALLMEWGWIDWAGGTIKIPVGEDIKTSYLHALGRVARDVLERRYAVEGADGLVFPNPLGRAGVISYNSARSFIDAAIGRAGVRPGTPHDFRHSYGRALALAGVPVTVIQKQLGHTTLAMTMKYMSTDVEHSARFVADFGVGE